MLFAQWRQRTTTSSQGKDSKVKLCSSRGPQSQRRTSAAFYLKTTRALSETLSASMTSYWSCFSLFAKLCGARAVQRPIPGIFLQTAWTTLPYMVCCFACQICYHRMSVKRTILVYYILAGKRPFFSINKNPNFLPSIFQLYLLFKITKNYISWPKP